MLPVKKTRPWHRGGDFLVLDQKRSPDCIRRQGNAGVTCWALAYSLTANQNKGLKAGDCEKHPGVRHADRDALGLCWRGCPHPDMPAVETFGLHLHTHRGRGSPLAPRIRRQQIELSVVCHSPPQADEKRGLLSSQLLRSMFAHFSVKL